MAALRRTLHWQPEPVEHGESRALIDSPKAEGEKPPKMLYVAFDCLGNPYAVSTRPEHIACDPARIKPYVPVEAEGEDSDGIMNRR